MPQFDFTTYSSQIFWFSICFAILYFAMNFVILPRIKNIISERKNLIDSDVLSAEKLDDQITEIQTKTDILRKEANKKYQSKLEESTRDAMKQREKMIEEFKTKIDDISKKSRLELKSFVEKSNTQSESVIQSLVQTIKAKIFS